MWLELDYRLLKDWKAIVITTIAVVLIYNFIVYLHPENMDWMGSADFSLLNALGFILVDQILFELITAFIVFRLIRLYAIRLRLFRLRLSPKELGLYQLKFLPVLLIAFFLFAPFTLTVRFLYHNIYQLNWDLYMDQYFYSTKLYIVYMLPVLLFGYGIINANLIMLYNHQLGATKIDLRKARKPKVRNRLWATDDWGEMFLDVDKIFWIERQERKSFAKTGTDKYRLKENITELSEKLDPNKFVRINRATLVNLEFVQNYSFWENDKYVLRMNDDDKSEFVMSRERLQKIKHMFLETS
ncbi:MAG: LytTR family DNA-binding domain-containing protein [Cyclobacteriaceae bacterium]